LKRYLSVLECVPPTTNICSFHRGILRLLAKIAGSYRLGILSIMTFSKTTLGLIDTEHNTHHYTVCPILFAVMLNVVAPFVPDTVMT